MTLVTTLQCTAACDHCCFGCSPGVRERIPEDRLARLIDEARAIPSLKNVSFVGGEAFLLGPELDLLMQRASGYGFHVQTTTNGYWAVNAKAAEKRITRLRDCGLRKITFSTGEFHAAYVPVERIVNGALAAFDAGLDVYIMIETFAGTAFDESLITGDPKIAALLDRERFHVNSHPWIPNANGIGSRALRHDPAESRFANRRFDGCRVVLDDITVTPDLSLYACCGQPIQAIPELRLGSVAERTIAEVLALADDDVVKMMIHIAGPERLALRMKQLVPDFVLPTADVHPCQTCLALHRDPAALGVLRRDLEAAGDAIHTLFRSVIESRAAV